MTGVDDEVHDHYRRSCAAARAGDATTAVAVLRTALDRGFWYGEAMLRESPSLSGLRGDAAFEAVVRDSLTAARRAVLVAPPAPVRRPPGPGPYPGLLALHGNGGCAEESMRAWQPAVAEGWLLAAAASGQWIASGHAEWADEDRADRDVLTAHGRVAADISPGRLVVAGFSLGAGTGLRLALTGRLPAAGVIAVATAGPRMADPDGWSPLIAGQRLRVYLIVGADDDAGRRADKHRRLAAQLAASGIAAELEVLPGLDHEYPHDFAPLIRRALAFVDPGRSSD